MQLPRPAPSQTSRAADERRESSGVACGSRVLGGRLEPPALRRRGPGLLGAGRGPIRASGDSPQVSPTLAASLCPPKPQGREGGTKASAAEAAFAGFSFGVSFPCPSPYQGSEELQQHVTDPPQHISGSHGTSLAPSLRTRGLLLNSRGIKCLHIFISRKHILKYKGD